MNAMTDFPPLETADNTIDFAALAKQPPLPAVLQDIADISNGKAVVKLNATEAGLSALRADLHGKSYDLTTTKGDKDARADRKRCVDLRTALEKKRKELKAPALDFGRLIDAEAKRITEAVLLLEAPIDAAIKADEDRREAERLERARLEAERIAGLKGQADAIMRGWLERCAEPDMTAERIGKGIEKFNALTVPADLADVADYWSAQQSITLGRMQTMQADLARREEAARLATERAELERQRAELEAQQAAARAELARLEQERKAAEEAAKFAAFAGSMNAAIEKAQRTDEIVPVADLPAAEEQAQEGVAENPHQQQAGLSVLSPADAAADDGAGDEVAPNTDDSPAAPAFVRVSRGYFPFGGVDPKFCPGSNPEAPQEFPEQRFPNEAPAFDLTPEPTDLLGDAATDAPHDTLHDLRALLAHIDAAFTGRFPSHPKPDQSWWATLRTLRDNLNA